MCVALSTLRGAAADVRFMLPGGLLRCALLAVTACTVRFYNPPSNGVPVCVAGVTISAGRLFDVCRWPMDGRTGEGSSHLRNRRLRRTPIGGDDIEAVVPGGGCFGGTGS